MDGFGPYVPWVPRGAPGSGGCVGPPQALAGQFHGARPLHAEVVAQPEGSAALMVQDQQVVGQVQHQVALVVRTGVVLGEGLQLQRQIVVMRPFDLVGSL